MSVSFFTNRMLTIWVFFFCGTVLHNQPFDDNVTLIKREGIFTGQKCMGSALIAKPFTVNLRLGSHDILPFLEDFL